MPHKLVSASALSLNIHVRKVYEEDGDEALDVRFDCDCDDTGYTSDAGDAGSHPTFDAVTGGDTGDGAGAGVCDRGASDECADQGQAVSGGAGTDSEFDFPSEVSDSAEEQEWEVWMQKKVRSLCDRVLASHVDAGLSIETCLHARL